MFTTVIYKITRRTTTRGFKQMTRTRRSRFR